MMTSEKSTSTAYDYLHLADGAVPVGVLEMTSHSREATASFRYGQRYLQRKDRMALDPVQLPLPEPGVEQRYIAPEGFALFNGIRDASPDAWGRRLMDRAAGAKTLSEYDYLMATGEDRVGALAFGPDLSGPQRITSWRTEKYTGEEAFDLVALLKAVQSWDRDKDFRLHHRHFLMPGSSLGGARPKATTQFKGRQWIAKFGRTEDRIPICRVEYATMTLAKKVGLKVPSVHLEKISGQDIYLIERFDRIPHEAYFLKVPFISGLTITGAHESEFYRQSYRRLAEQLRLYGSHPTEDARELWQRMVFNILCTNTDDHLRNHGFLWNGKGWRLSPAYDIVPLPQTGIEKDLAIGVGQEGRKATLKNALSHASHFGLAQAEALRGITDLQQAVKKTWEKLFKNCGLTAHDLDLLRNCFSACDEKIGME